MIKRLPLSFMIVQLLDGNWYAIFPSRAMAIANQWLFPDAPVMMTTKGYGFDVTEIT